MLRSTGGTSCLSLDSFVDLADKFGADIQAGTQLRAHFGQEASIGGGYAVAVLGQETDNADPLVGEFVTAVKAPTKLITASPQLCCFSQTRRCARRSNGGWLC